MFQPFPPPLKAFRGGWAAQHGGSVSPIWASPTAVVGSGDGTVHPGAVLKLDASTSSTDLEPWMNFLAERYQDILSTQRHFLKNLRSLDSLTCRSLSYARTSPVRTNHTPVRVGSGVFLPGAGHN